MANVDGDEANDAAADEADNEGGKHGHTAVVFVATVVVVVVGGARQEMTRMG